MALFYQHILFDLDGTLVNTGKEIISSIKIVLKKEGRLFFDSEKVMPYVGKGLTIMIMQAIKQNCNINDFNIEELRKKILEFYEKNLLLSSKTYEGVYELLLLLKKNNITYSVVTSKPSFLARPLLEKLNIKPYVLICGDTLKYTKPHSAPIIEAMNKANIDKKYTMMVGDDENDMLSAKNAGILSIFANYGYGFCQEKYIDKKITKPLDLLSLL